MLDWKYKSQGFLSDDYIITFHEATYHGVDIVRQTVSLRREGSSDTVINVIYKIKRVPIVFETLNDVFYRIDKELY